MQPQFLGIFLRSHPDSLPLTVKYVTGDYLNVTSEDGYVEKKVISSKKKKSWEWCADGVLILCVFDGFMRLLSEWAMVISMASNVEPSTRHR